MVSGGVMQIIMKPIGVVHVKAEKIPRHWTVSKLKGELEIDKKYVKGMQDIKKGQKIIVIFHFNKSTDFSPDFLTQTPPVNKREHGVFSICSPMRPNPIGMSVLDVLDIQDNIISVKGIDMLDKTPILDLKPFIQDKHSCPSYRQNK